MKATVDGRVIAESSDIIEHDGYAYFPPSAVRTEWLEKAPRTAADQRCPHSVQFYDVIVDGKRHVRGAWVYEAPRPNMPPLGGRFGFWEDVKVE